MTGTILNIITVLIGGALGLLFRAALPERLRQTIVAGLGLFTAAIGFKMFGSTQNELIVLGALLLGGLFGELLKIEDGLRSLGGWLESRFMGRKAKPAASSPENAPLASEKESQTELDSRQRFIRGFLTASLLFCVGPMTILGSIQDGLTGDFQLLAIKSVLDGFAALAFASTLGAGVLFSALVILLYQGGLSLLAAQAQALISEPMMAEMTAVGGVLLIGLAISSLLEIKPIRVGNFLPALVFAPILVGWTPLIADLLNGIKAAIGF